MGPLLLGKIPKIVIYDQARVNGGSNYEYLGQRRVPKLVSINMKRRGGGLCVTVGISIYM